MNRRRTIVALVLLSSAAACDGCVDAPDGGGAQKARDIAAKVRGAWTFTWTVETATGACADEVGDTSEGTVDIDGDVDDLALDGFGNDEDESLTGSIDGHTLTFGGAFSDGSGTTTTSTTATFADDFASLTGTERWTWGTDAQPDACPEDTSSLVGSKDDAP